MPQLTIHTDTSSEMKLLLRVLNSPHFDELLQIHTDEFYNNLGNANLEFGTLFPDKKDIAHFYVTRKLTEEDYYDQP